MFKALAVDDDGAQIVLLGLDFANLDRLADDQPIRVRSVALDVRPGFDMWIVGGPDRQHIADDMAAVGAPVPPGADDTGAVLRYVTDWRAPTHPLQLAVFGVTTAGDRLLRAGAAYRLSLPGRAVSVHLFAAATVADCVRQVGAGRHP